MPRAWFAVLLGAAVLHGAGCIPTDRLLADPAAVPAVQPSLRVPLAETGVPTNVIIRVGLDRAALASTVDQTSVWIEVDGARLDADVAYEPLDREITITPLADLPSASEVRVFLGAGIRSYGGPRFEGAALGEDVRFEFTTSDGPDVLPPEISSTPGVIEVVPETLRDSGCGDGICDDGSTNPAFDEGITCSFDCSPGGLCGNGVCDPGESRSACPPDCGTPFALRAIVGPDAVTDDTSDERELRWFAYIASTSGGQDFAAPHRMTRLGTDGGDDVYRILGLAACGDGLCHGENHETCPADCNQFCGDEVCTGTETDFNCRRDCPNSCGDGICSGGTAFREEAVCPDPGVPCDLCPADCDVACGDTVCAGAETSETCPRDCGFVCPNGTCEAFENSAVCASDCPELCGDGACSTGETEGSCAQDCAAEFFVVIGVADASGNEILTSFEASAVTRKSIPRGFQTAYSETGCHCTKCHGDEVRAPVDFWMPVSGTVGVPLTGVDPHALLVGVPSREEPSVSLVEPGNAASSYLLLKMIGPRCATSIFGTLASVSGFIMPAAEEAKTDVHCHTLVGSPNITAIMDWMDLGAVNDADPAELGSCDL